MTRRDLIEGHLAQIAAGDRAALAALYAATSGKLFAVVLGVLRDRPEAEDTLQEVYIKIWKGAGKYSANGLSPMTWLITVARNASIDRLRRRRPATTGSDVLAEVADPAPGPESLALQSLERSRIAACLDELQDDRADAVRRAYLHGASYQELADHFRVPLNTMRTWLRRSLLALRECMTR